MLPDAAKPAALNMLFELLDIPNKAEFLENMRTALNIPKKPEDMNPQEQQAAQQQAQQAQAQQELAMREIMAKVAKLEAEAARWQAESQRLAALAESQRFGDAKTQAETGKILHGDAFVGSSMQNEDLSPGLAVILSFRSGQAAMKRDEAKQV